MHSCNGWKLKTWKIAAHCSAFSTRHTLPGLEKSSGPATMEFDTFVFCVTVIDRRFPEIATHSEFIKEIYYFQRYL